MRVRLADKSDLHSLSEVYSVAYNSLNIGENWTPETAYPLIEYLFNDQPDLFFVIQEDEGVVGGIVATVRPWWDGNHLIEGELFVHPEHQKKKYGVLLIKTLFSEAKNKYNVVSWDTFTHRIYEHPLSWYKKLGFEEIKQWTMIAGNVQKVLDTIGE
jgi:GNAT superfamily N-acetyltransferase